MREPVKLRAKILYDLGSDVSDEARFQLLSSDAATGRMSNAQVLVPELEVSLVGLSLKIAGRPVKARWPGSSVAVVDTITHAPEALRSMRKMRRALRDKLASTAFSS